MFAARSIFKQTEVIKMTEVADFIEKPSQDCNQEELKKGTSQIQAILSKDPNLLFNILDDSMAPNFLFGDLIVKMKSQNCVESLGILVDYHLHQLVGTCIWNLNDLALCVNEIPNCLDKVLGNILSSEKHGKQILECEYSPEKTLPKLIAAYPAYEDKFREFYYQHYNRKLTP